MASTPVGKLDQRITVQQKGPTPDTQGGRAIAWTTFASLWASVRSLNADEREQVEAIQPLVRYEVEIHYRADVLATMRVSWRPYRAVSAKTLQILGVRLREGRPDRLLLECEEVAA